jgi:AcrR family transcriptional regulator
MPPDPPTGTREQILAAARDLIRERGLGAATTRAIAERARCAEGNIYRYFRHKHALFLELVKEEFPEYMALCDSFQERAGRGTVRRNLEELVMSSLAFYRAILPMGAGAMAERELLRRQRRYFVQTGTGPLRLARAVADYLRREQRLGRVSGRLSADHAARLLLGASFYQAFLEHFLGPPAELGSDERYARDVVGALMEGLSPGGGGTG